MRLFVPGRICMFGEHSDWAGGYRRTNAEIEKGYAIITGTNQGIYADVEPHPSKLVMNTHFENGNKSKSFEISMNSKMLLQEAQKGEFYSYACGVAYQMLTLYNVRGLNIKNFKMDLPIKKGLSSSAAICVLVARAFNRLYDLKLTVRGEMEIAYQGEITTPSRCGRMDQGCAYGNRPVLMVFDGDRIDVEELRISRDLYFILVDLKTEKDTVEILAKLNRCFPFAENKDQRNAHQYLGPINKRIVQEAKNALGNGAAEKIGQLMTKAQAEFDAHLTPVCPGQLTAPVLHSLLQYRKIKPYILGGKGVGSQGDGSAQLLALDEESQMKAITIIEKDLGMSCLPLIIKSVKKIRKAVIPAAGFGTRLFPATKAVKKELFPIVDEDGHVKPVILVIVEELIHSGIEEIAIIVQERDRETFENLFHLPPNPENLNKLSKEDKEYSKLLSELGNHITFIFQDIQEGFGHAVFCARDWVGDEPFLLTLGDYLFMSKNEVTCTRQLMEMYEQYNTNIVGIKTIPRSDLNGFGCVAGKWKRPGSLLEISEFIEKPSQKYAKENLRLDGIEDDTYIGLFGQYIIEPKIFKFLEESIEHNLRQNDGEFELTSCLDQLREEEGFLGYLVEGRSFDIGKPEKYLQTMIDYRRN